MSPMLILEGCCFVAASIHQVVFPATALTQVTESPVALEGDPWAVRRGGGQTYTRTPCAGTPRLWDRRSSIVRQHHESGPGRSLQKAGKPVGTCQRQIRLSL